MNADFACLEVDEANMPLLLKRLTPDIVAVSNLFRDQLDRYGEIDITANLLKKAFLLAPQAIAHMMYALSYSPSIKVLTNLIIRRTSDAVSATNMVGILFPQIPIKIIR